MIAVNMEFNQTKQVLLCKNIKGSLRNALQNANDANDFNCVYHFVFFMFHLIEDNVNYIINFELASLYKFYGGCYDVWLYYNSTLK